MADDRTIGRQRELRAPSAAPRRGSLDALFSPRTVAIVGATDRAGSVGRSLVENLATFPGRVYPLSLGRTTVLGIPCHARLADVPEQVDLAVIATPAPTVPGVIAECVEAGVAGAIVISAGFKEIGAAGAALEQQILASARRGSLRIVGPNCLGVMTPHAGLNATFAAAAARPGNVAFVSQSGALCTAILDWSLREKVGFSAFVSVGSMLDVGWGDIIYHLGDDPHTRSILCYMESIGDARAFLSAAREVGFTKPIIVVKVGRTQAAASAAASHTGALTGSDEVLDAAFRRAGVLRVSKVQELFDMAEALGKQPRPAGPRLAILTNAGGPGALATDSLIEAGGQLADLAPETVTALDALLPPHWSRQNPVDILGDADSVRYASALACVTKDANSDGALVILTPQAMTDPSATAHGVVAATAGTSKPILACWMGGPAVDEGEAVLNGAGIPTLKYPERAATAFAYMWRYSANLAALYETPALLSDSDVSAAERARASEILRAVRDTGRTLLTELESKQILSAYGIPTVPTHAASSADEAVALAEKIGYPVVVKLLSRTLTHKTDVGGVQLDLRDAASVREAWRAIEASVAQRSRASDFEGVTVQPMMPRDGYELIVGSSIDLQFGPVLLFGTGGQLVEVFADRALALPPLNATLARRMMEQTRIYRALLGVRGRRPVDLAALERVLVRFSDLVIDQRWIREIDINPLLVSADRIIALDARVVVYGAETGEDQLARSAIRPYPAQYVSHRTLRDGTAVTIRPIRPEDEPLMVAFHHTLSDRSVYYRYFSSMRLDQRVAHERLARLCFIDYDRQMALVAERSDPRTGEREIIGVGRLIKQHVANEAEFALVIADRWQKLGLGTSLLELLVRFGRDEKLERITATILPENTDMQYVARKAGFDVRHEAADECRATLAL